MTKDFCDNFLFSKDRGIVDHNLSKNYSQAGPCFYRLF